MQKTVYEPFYMDNVQFADSIPASIVDRFRRLQDNHGGRRLDEIAWYPSGALYVVFKNNSPLRLRITKQGVDYL